MNIVNKQSSVLEDKFYGKKSRVWSEELEVWSGGVEGRLQY